jgi:hypothetical protein
MAREVGVPALAEPAQHQDLVQLRRTGPVQGTDSQDLLGLEGTVHQRDVRRAARVHPQERVFRWHRPSPWLSELGIVIC